MLNSSSLRTFLEERATLVRQLYPDRDWKYAGFEELVLNCGIEMEANPLPKNINFGLSQACYWNCQQLAFKRKSLIYVEGYALDPEISFPIAHAWLITKDKKVIDPTWKTSNSYYLGIPFSTQWVKNILKSRPKNKTDISIIEGNYLEGFSLLKDGIPTEALPLGFNSR